jgi:hypothetical protein
MKSNTEQSRSKKGSRIAVVLLAVLPLFFVLSYAPLYRWIQGGDTKPPHSSCSLWLMCSNTSSGTEWWQMPYRPVIFLIDHTPLGTPLQWWADVWDVDDAIATDRFHRERYPHLYGVLKVDVMRRPPR